MPWKSEPFDRLAMQVGLGKITMEGAMKEVYDNPRKYKGFDYTRFIDFSEALKEYKSE